MNKKYLVTELPEHLEAIRIVDESDWTLKDPIAFRESLFAEILCLTDRLSLLENVIKQKGLNVECSIPIRITSKFDPNYSFRAFFNTQFHTIERIVSLKSMGLSEEEIELEASDAIYQKNILNLAILDLFQAIYWYSNYCK